MYNKHADRVADGTLIRLRDGQVWMKLRMRNGRLNGFRISYYPNSNLRSQGVYFEERSGLWAFYDEDGTVNRYKYYNKAGELLREDINPQNEDNLNSSEHYFRRNRIQGYSIFYYPDGQIQQHGCMFYKRGILRSGEYIRHGLWIFYNPDGTVWKNLYYDNDGNLMKMDIVGAIDD